MILNTNYRTRLFNKIGGDQENTTKVLLDNYIITGKRGFIWDERKRNWQEVDINHLKHQVRCIVWNYFKYYSKNSIPHFDTVYDLITNDSIIFNDTKEKFLIGNNIVRDLRSKKERNILKEDYLT